jgi:threonylcarbamoyladenosine tRNA methylthiotransferase MtaB
MNRFMVRTLGCKANASDGQQIELGLRSMGWLPADSEENADLIVVNSCTVTDEADKQSRRTATRASRLNPKARIVYTGCGAEVNPALSAQIPGVSAVIGNSDKQHFARYATIDSKGVLGGVLDYEAFRSEHPMDREWAVPEANFSDLSQLERGSGTHRTRAFVKIQEGCDHFCTYCVIPYGRGPARALGRPEIVNAIQELIETGTQEVILTGTNIGDHPELPQLIENLLRDIQVPRLRVSSLDPVEITPEILNLMERYDNFCPHFHVSLQSPHSLILRRMKRKYGEEDVVQTLTEINKIRSGGVFVGMDVITGFPGETDEVFEATRLRLLELPWDRLHVFPYSERSGTPATRLPDSVPMEIRKARARVLSAMSLHRLETRFKKKIESGLVEVQDVLWESLKQGRDGQLRLSGLTKDYERVIALASAEDKVLLNRTSSARILGYLVDRPLQDVHWNAEALR